MSASTTKDLGPGVAEFEACLDQNVSKLKFVLSIASIGLNLYCL